jgi:hypothetical protein
MRGFCSRDDRVYRCVQRLMGGRISRHRNGLRHADSSLDFALHGFFWAESSSRSGSIQTKLSLAGTVTVTVKGRFGGSPQNTPYFQIKERFTRVFATLYDRPIRESATLRANGFVTRHKRKMNMVRFKAQDLYGGAKRTRRHTPVGRFRGFANVSVF